MTWIITSITCAAAFSVALVATGRCLAKSVAVDVPCERSSHKAPTPTGGGVGILAGFFGPALALTALWPEAARPDPWPLFLLVLPLAIMGWADDKQGVPRLLRLIVQLAMAGAALWWYRPPWPGLGAPWWSVAAAYVAGAVIIAALVNFYNFMDGMDGFVGGVSTVQFALLAVLTSDPLWWALAAALAGFLFWNWPPAKIFMGDVGSTSLGFLAALAVLVYFGGDRSAPGLVWPMAASATPLLGDALYTISRRLLRRENIFDAHHSHIYQRLMRSGLSHRAVSLIYIAATLASGLAAVFRGAIGFYAALGILAVGIAAAEIRAKRKRVPFAVGGGR